VTFSTESSTESRLGRQAQDAGPEAEGCALTQTSVSSEAT